MKKISIFVPALLLAAAISYPSLTAAQNQDNSAKEIFSMTCAACHGDDGSQPVSSAKRTIKGQTQDQVLEKLKGYAAGTYGGQRKSVMEDQVKNLTPEQLASLADYVGTFSQKTKVEQPATADEPAKTDNPAVTDSTPTVEF